MGEECGFHFTDVLCLQYSEEFEGGMRDAATANHIVWRFAKYLGCLLPWNRSFFLALTVGVTKMKKYMVSHVLDL